ncbi:MAG TPA: HU family DNA-binding protein [Nevskiaceae bacterium]|nr:HU family DNA-binding protein [Nevskiaceae bacterium]
MNKQELVAVAAKDAEVSKADAKRVLDAAFAAVGKTLKKHEHVQVIGFGTFLARKRKARKARNPRTGEAIKVKAGWSPAFKAGAGLKAAVR